MYGSPMSWSWSTSRINAESSEAGMTSSQRSRSTSTAWQLWSYPRTTRWGNISLIINIDLPGSDYCALITFRRNAGANPSALTTTSSCQPPGPISMALLTTEFCGCNHHFLLTVQGPNFCTSCVTEECLVMCGVPTCSSKNSLLACEYAWRKLELPCFQKHWW